MMVKQSRHGADDCSTRFLDNSAIAPAIREVTGGGDVRCAVAFWGDGAASALFGGGLPEHARVICDVSMGGTNPKELVALGAPDEKCLRHLRGLHAKVYVSDRGLVVGSANASDNGIGFVDVARLTEAGTFHAAGTDAHKRAGIWFDGIWKRSRKVSPKVLQEAEEAWRRRKRASRLPARSAADPSSLLAVVAADPARFRGVGFVFTSGTSTTEQREDARDALVEQDDGRDTPLLSKTMRKALGAWPLGDVFSEWTVEELSAWPMRFVCAHRGARGRISYWFYERTHPVIVDDEQGMVLASRPRDMRAELGFLRGREAMAVADAARLRSIFESLDDGIGHRLCENGHKLVEMLADLDLLG